MKRDEEAREQCHLSSKSVAPEAWNLARIIPPILDTVVIVMEVHIFHYNHNRARGISYGCTDTRRFMAISVGIAGRDMYGKAMGVEKCINRPASRRQSPPTHTIQHAFLC